MSVLVNSYFSGTGLMEIGLQRAGLTLQQSFEIDPVCVENHRANFDHEIRACDLRAKLVRDEKPCHVKVATYPCNKYSKSADLHGTRTGDDLFLHFFRNLAIEPPEVYVVENVPGMRKFPVVMEAMTRLPGYYVHVECPVQSELWLPQRRDRLIIIGSRRPFAWRAPESTRRVHLSEIVERDPDVHIPRNVISRLRGKYRDRPIISDPDRDDLAPTCVAHYHKDRGTRLVADRRFKYGARPYTVREYARLQGIPDAFTFRCSEAHAYRMIGLGVSVPVGEWIGREIARYFGL
ncbi:DNA cytosine methyltransferase [Opitutus sp. ER46]|uniref:DNA cytosine methyltransferase n=1 Tax=Opitutus sp. ER46 TaxID=2161864 RepID=UPI000D3039AC|nr:DNA cytosine methyltransferase [Opitutus sp. ER46]PTX95739.1 DNA (cytosine-5-)-methyltransferase [Opitutus sp. ER46]